MSSDSLELTHQDLAEAIDRVISQIRVVASSKIYMDLKKTMFDLDDIDNVLQNVKSRLVTDAYKKGVLEWK
jgi:hypothetical protein